MKPGIYPFPRDIYHADPSDTPSLSVGIARLLISASPKHAWTAHPKLNPAYEPDDDPKYDIGTVAHAALLEGYDVCAVIDADDWRTKAAREARDDARANGKVPLLAKDYDRVRACVEAAVDQLEHLDADPPIFAPGRPEQTIVWEDHGVTCRALIDWLHDDHRAIDDLKTTSRSANPEAFTRSLFNYGYDVQAAFYMRGVRALTGVTPEFRFVVVETHPPYALSVVSVAPSAMEIANAKVDYAIDKWRRCLDANEWPAYPTRVCFAELPGYEEARWLEREAREEMAA